MNDELKTVEDVEIEDTQDTESILITEKDFEDPIITQQKEDVSKMRTSLLSCNGDPTNFRQAINNITVLRVYHQLSRIIKYTEMMDKLEEKLYESIGYTLDTIDTTSGAGAWLPLMTMQEKLQKAMITSQKLLQPYLEMNWHDMGAMAASSESSNVTIPLDAKSRDSLRASAQNILALLDGSNND